MHGMMSRTVITVFDYDFSNFIIQANFFKDFKGLVYEKR